MKIRTFALSFVLALAACGGPEDGVEQTDDALLATPVEVTGVVRYQPGGFEGGGLILTKYKCDATKDNCGNFSTDCSTAGGTFGSDRGGINQSCDCGKAKDEAACDKKMQGYPTAN